MGIASFFSSLFGGAPHQEKSTPPPAGDQARHLHHDRHKADAFLLDLAIKHQVRLDLDIATANGSKCLPGILPLKRESGQLFVQRGTTTSALKESTIAIVLLAAPADLAKNPTGANELLKELSSCAFPNLRAQGLYTMESLDGQKAAAMAVEMAADPSPEVRTSVAKVVRRSLKIKKRMASGVSYSFMDPPPTQEILLLLENLRRDSDPKVTAEVAEAQRAISNSSTQRTAYETAIQAKKVSKKKPVSAD